VNAGKPCGGEKPIEIGFLAHGLAGGHGNELFDLFDPRGYFRAGDQGARVA
jgi:hypothetical protein